MTSEQFLALSAIIMASHGIHSTYRQCLSLLFIAVAFLLGYWK